MNFLDYFLENTQEQYAIAGVIVLSSVILFYIIEHLIIGRIVKDEEYEGEGTRRQLEAFAKGIEKFLSLPLTLLAGIYIASFYLVLPPIVGDIIYWLVVLFAAYYLLQASFTVLDYTLLVTKHRTGQEHIVNFLRFLLRGVILVLILLWFLSQLSIDITAFLAGFGILGLGFAFALQNVLADLFASITIYMDRPFEIGDTIRVGTDVGTVEKIGLKSTQLRTPLGNQLIISNRELTNSRINNMKRMDTRRIEMVVGVAYETSIDKLEKIPEWIKEIVESYEDTKFNWTYFTEMAAASLNYKIVYQITTPDAMIWLKTQQAINLAILRKFQEEGIDIPFPVQKVMVQNI